MILIPYLIFLEKKDFHWSKACMVLNVKGCATTCKLFQIDHKIEVVH